MSTTIACVNQKGGVGKTTTTATVGHVMVRDYGLRVLLVDMDPQASLTRGLVERDIEAEGSMYGVIANEAPVSDVIIRIEGESASGTAAENGQAAQAARVPDSAAAEALADSEQSVPSAGRSPGVGEPDEPQRAGETRGPVLDLAPAHPQMNALVTILANMPGWATLMREAIQEVVQDYDVILLDTRPNREHLEMLAMSGSDYLVIPVNAAPYATFATEDLMETVRLVRKRTNPELEVLGAVITLYDERNRVCREVGQEIEEYFGDLVFGTRIRRNTTLERVPASATSILDLDPRANGAADYRALTEEVISRVRG